MRPDPDLFIVFFFCSAWHPVRDCGGLCLEGSIREEKLHREAGGHMLLLFQTNFFE